MTPDILQLIEREFPIPDSYYALHVVTRILQCKPNSCVLMVDIPQVYIKKLRKVFESLGYSQNSRSIGPHLLIQCSKSGVENERRGRIIGFELHYPHLIANRRS